LTATSPGRPWLVADIGGTNARFGWVGVSDDAVGHVRKLPVADYAGPADAARAYLRELGGIVGPALAVPRRASIAVATAVEAEEIALTNSAWRFTRAGLAADLGVETLLVLNDFEALALSLPGLKSHQWRAFGAPPPGRGTLAVVGPGTGLGVGGVVSTAGRWIALPGEGGHATLASTDDFEARVIEAARRRYDHVSAERLLSGIGLPLLYEAVGEALGAAVEALTAEQVVERGVSAADPVAVRTIETFCALLGAFCGNVALTLGARGGLYIGGGIVPRLGEAFFASRFRERFEAKGRFRGYLEGIPTALIIDTLAALAGAAFALEQHGP
jgi:glucokinase